jgi:phosphoglycolate phosphatase-like HAD superfamily hydrolase
MRATDGREIRVRNIIWDVDGTLFDTYPAIAGAFRAALRDLDADASLDRITALARESLATCAATLARSAGLDRNAFEDAFLRHYEAIPADAQPPFAGAREVCERICWLDGDNVIVTHRGARQTAALLAAAGLDAYISGCITASDGFPRKPDPAAFRAILERHDLDPAETLAIGDRTIDIEAGRAAGVLTACFAPPETTGGTARDPGAGIAADLLVTDLRELAAALVRW